MTTTGGVKYPHIHVHLSGLNGFAVISTVRAAIQDTEGDWVAGDFAAEAMAGGYANVVETASRWVTVS